ncbi:putative quinol monooxygenase [Mobilicoccus massiliensis]|uniref:putative quinol monooxygenase n=1 Tax=Mobilicoccus massiliensis TaxID=1522310 RepID=UPI00058DCDD4|nr:putative quinol monooxygenase [Mobilicoccus massiliensis]
MILINVKFSVKPEFAEDWPSITEDFTRATLAEPKNLWFEWSRSIAEPNTYVLIEAFEDDGAEAHVNSEHFAEMQREFPKYLACTPDIVNGQIPATGWDKMAEITVD